jgi:hypothetical protein
MLHDSIIVTGGDAAYYPLIDELRQSIIAAAYPSEPPAFGVIDAGLTPRQTRALQGEGAIVVTLPDMPFIAPSIRERRPGLAANLSKPWLNVLFPGHDTLIWLDADTWVQDFAAVRLLHGAAQGGALAIVPGSGRFWDRQLDVRWLFGGLGGLCQMRSFLFKNGSHAGLSRAVLRDLGNRALLNAGAFALTRQAPHWATMQERQKTLLRAGGKVFSSDQMAISLAVYVDGLPVELLPDTCNYIRPWRADLKAGVLVEYYYPYPKVGIVHLAGQKTIRFDPAATTEVTGLDGHIYQLNVRFGHFQRMAAELADGAATASRIEPLEAVDLTGRQR